MMQTVEKVILDAGREIRVECSDAGSPMWTLIYVGREQVLSLGEEAVRDLRYALGRVEAFIDAKELERAKGKR
jgi:hypothetical protein